LHQAPRGRRVQHAVDHQRRGFLSAIGIEVGIPGEAELLRVVGRDFGQRAEALLAIGASIAQPVRTVAVGGAHPFCIDARGHAGGLRWAYAEGEDERRSETCRKAGEPRVALYSFGGMKVAIHCISWLKSTQSHCDLTLWPPARNFLILPTGESDD